MSIRATDLARELNLTFSEIETVMRELYISKQASYFLTEEEENSIRKCVEERCGNIKVINSYKNCSETDSEEISEDFKHFLKHAAVHIVKELLR